MKSKKIGALGGVIAAGMLAAGLVMPSASAAPTVVTIWTDLDRASAFQAWAKVFNRKNPTIAVNVLGKDGHKDKLKTVSDADAPDIIVGAHDWVGPLKSDGSILPVTIANGSQFDQRDKDAFKLQGATYGVPIAVENIALFRNANMVPKAPKTMADVEATCKKFLKKNTKSKFCIAVSPGDPYHMYPFFSGLGGYVFGGASGNWNTNKLGLANKTFIKNSALIDKWYREKLFNTNVTGDTALAAFTGKQAPFMVTGPWNLDKIRLKNINYELSPFPTIIKGIKSVPFYGVQGAMRTKWAAPGKHNNVIKVNRVLADLTTKDAQLRIANATIRTPANKLARAAFKDPDSASFFVAGQGAITMPQILEMGAVWTPLGNAWSQVKSDKVAANRFKKAQTTISKAIR
ncbi:MAG: extracellular solute-binding protein [Actinomycetales bacterium]|nr:extracellular solute-binding protein [Actinomycetales bacterium]